MPTPYFRRLLAAAPLLSLLHTTILHAQQPFDSSAWNISGAEWRVDSYSGQSSLFLRTGTAWLKGSSFDNGTIDFDVAFSNSTAFPGIGFRAITHSVMECCYLRAMRSAQWDATQYTPVLHGLYGWQIYTGAAYNAALTWKFDQ